MNKKVLLRERKRHTACCVASARTAALSSDRGGVGKYPHPVLTGRYPHPVSMGQAIPIQSQPLWVCPARVFPHQPDGSTHYQLDGGTPLLAKWGYPPPHEEGWGPSDRKNEVTPLSARWGYLPRVWTTEDITFRHPSDAGGKILEFYTPILNERNNSQKSDWFDIKLRHRSRYIPGMNIKYL